MQSFFTCLFLLCSHAQSGEGSANLLKSLLRELFQQCDCSTIVSQLCGTPSAGCFSTAVETDGSCQVKNPLASNTTQQALIRILCKAWLICTCKSVSVSPVRCSHPCPQSDSKSRLIFPRLLPLQRFREDAQHPAATSPIMCPVQQPPRHTALTSAV